MEFLSRALKVSTIALLVLSSGCASIIQGQTAKFADNLSQAVLDQEDPELVADGLPSYLLLLDGLIRQSPENSATMLSAARLNSSYASVFTDDEKRAKVMSKKALDYSLTAICLDDKNLCDLKSSDFETFSTKLASMNAKNLESFYVLAGSWATYIQAHSEDWNAIAELSRVQAVMEKVITLDETFDHGNAHLYLGVLSTLVPPALGGKPEVGRKHFERAIEISEGKNLFAKVTFAQQYARLMFDQELHDNLVEEVLSSDPNVEGLTLTNVIAQQQAENLKASAAEYF